MSRNVLITGITGQDGSYLAELLLEKGYCVYGLGRRVKDGEFGCAAHLKDSVHFLQADLNDVGQLVQVVKGVQPDEVYNLAAQSFMGTSWEQPILTCEINALGCQASGGHPSGKAGCPFFSGVKRGDVWACSGNASARDDAVFAQESLCHSEAVWALDDQELPGELRNVRMFRNSVQP